MAESLSWIALKLMLANMSMLMLPHQLQVTALQATIVLKAPLPQPKYPVPKAPSVLRVKVPSPPTVPFVPPVTIVHLQA